MINTLKSVTALDNYQVKLLFDNNEIRIFDFSPYINKNKFCELKNPSVFRSVKVSFDTIEFSNGLDIDPEFLYDKSIPN